jgi:hypothetical protein
MEDTAGRHGRAPGRPQFILHVDYVPRPPTWNGIRSNGISVALASVHAFSITSAAGAPAAPEAPAVIKKPLSNPEIYRLLPKPQKEKLAREQT